MPTLLVDVEPDRPTTLTRSGKQLLAGILLTTFAAAVSALFLTRSTTAPVAVLLTGVAVTAAWASLVDLRSQRLPDPLTLPALYVSALTFALTAALTSRWDLFLHAALGLVCATAIYYLMALFGGMGLGDVKLGALFGLCLGWLGFPSWLLGIAAAPVIAIILAIPHLIKKKATIKTHIPYGPAMTLAFAGVLFVHLPGF